MSGTPGDAAAESVETISALYLGNILYALERCAMALEAEGKRDEAAFYRGIGRKLAEARGSESGSARAPRSATKAK
jgi:hypothetical protein